MDTGKKIALCRKEAGMSQEALAAEMGISRQAVSRWETGEALPETAKVIQLARLFNVSTDYLLLDEAEGKDNTPKDMQSAAHSVAERRRTFRTVYAIIVTALGAILTFRAVSAAVKWSLETDWYWTEWGALGTALFRTGILLPFVIGILVLIYGIICLVMEYRRED